MCVRIFNPIHIGWQSCEKRSRAEQRCPFSQTPVYTIHRLTLMLVLGAYIKSPFFPQAAGPKLVHSHTHSDILIQKDLSRSLYYRVYSPKPASVKVLCTRLCSFTQSLSPGQSEEHRRQQSVAVPFPMFWICCCCFSSEANKQIFYLVG